jgi:hypothetical protein
LQDYGNFDNIYSSYSCGKHVSFNFCNDVPETTCNNDNGIHGAGTIATKEIGFNDQLSVLSLMAYDAEMHPAVTIYQDSNCRGKSGRFSASEVKTDTEFYNQSDLAAVGIGKDQMSSLMIPDNLFVTSFFEADWTGTHIDMPGAYVDSN